MHKEILRSITGIGIFPLISLLLFVGVFASALWRTLRMDRSDVQRLAGLPLDGPLDPVARGEAEVQP